MGSEWSGLVYGRIVATGLILLHALAAGQLPLYGGHYLPNDLTPMCQGGEVGLGMTRSCFENQHGFCTHQWATVFDNKWEVVADLKDRGEGTEWCDVEYPEGVTIECNENKVPTAVRTPLWDFPECYRANYCYHCSPFNTQHQVYYCCKGLVWKGNR